MSATATTNLYYEDIELGAQFESATHSVTPADIAAFADVTHDHHPLHLDEGYARSRGFPAVIAHGLYGLSLMEGLKSELRLYEETSVASLGWDAVRFKAPVVAGDSLRVRFRFVEKRPTHNPGRGIVVEALDLINQRDEVVTEARHVSLILTRQAED
ncbi:MaoC family dehydratase [Bosea vaviloviae]|uniref:Monoamine oxidase n=1 Tax=Bosea vaviloviae TaxID=1526658 RepID=A0A1D7U923_9HYPH|nr:MaoC/PaaZ C-terminal domain-containing protein [Bosea vaviloviae]AOO83885.1 monoamine oxidase [Bosea vaviloviae]